MNAWPLRASIKTPAWVWMDGWIHQQHNNLIYSGCCLDNYILNPSHSLGGVCRILCLLQCQKDNKKKLNVFKYLIFICTRCVSFFLSHSQFLFFYFDFPRQAGCSYVFMTYNNNSYDNNIYKV